MTDKPKLLTKAEWIGHGLIGADYSYLERVAILVNALFRYRERTRGWINEDVTTEFADIIAAEEGIE